MMQPAPLAAPLPARQPTTLLDCIRRLPPTRVVTAGLTAADLCTQVQAGAADLRRAGLGEGETVGLCLPNGDGWVLAFLALLTAGARPLLVAPETPDTERRRLMASAAAGRWVVAGPGPGQLRLAGPPGQAVQRPGVLLPTSGSTGQPTLVVRDEASLLAEARRYRDALGLDGHGRLLLPLPLSHAYALGWLAAALVTGMQVRAVPPTALHAIARELRDGATTVALVPTLARLLAARQLRRGGPDPAPELIVAMVGAGPVDESLEDAFRRAFGVATARNYGSTETGAIFAGLPVLPPLCVGTPMPSVEFRIVDDHEQPCAPGSAGALKVRLGPEMPWRDTMDLAVCQDSQVMIMGRRHRAVRRGGRWVAPLEVEAVLRDHPEVTDVHVWARRGRADGEDILVADIEATVPRSAADLASFARARLAPHKVPQEFRIREHLSRTPVGKVASARRYVLSDPATLLAAARAYRRSELLFVLHDLGALTPLESGASADELAASLGVEARELDWLLGVAAGLGLVTADGDGERRPAGTVPDPQPFIELESILSRTWLDRGALADTLRHGIDHRQFDRAEMDERLSSAYARAMHDAAARHRTALCLRLIRRLPRRRIVEVSAGPGRYLDQLLAADPSVTGCLVRLGRLSGTLAPAVHAAVADGRVEVRDDPPSGEFDLCVVANGIHGPRPGGDLTWLLDRLRPAGALLVDDVFLPADGGAGSELGLDWLTHGGIAWPHVESLTAGLQAAGWDIALQQRLGSSQCHVILATEG
jgi:long-chain acyl-CoA synthetase